MNVLDPFVCFLGAASACVASWGIIFWCKNHRFGNDSHLGGKPQRMHQHQVSRLGGLGIVIGMAVYAVLSTVPMHESVLQHEPFPVWVVFVGLPVFLLGLLEDLTGTVSARYRLGAAVASAMAACYLLQAILPFKDGGLLITTLMVLFSGFCVAGLINAFNIIDGLNGLSSGMALIALGLLAWCAHQFGDALLVQLALGTGCALLGFLVVNYPHGKIFLGDGGAYLIGFIVAEMAILLVVRHPSVSWFFPLACVIYPVTETLFSIYRRKFKNSEAQRPDALHLHSLVHRRLNHWRRDIPAKAALRNALSTTFFWVWQLLSAFVILLIWDSQLLLIGFCIVQVGVYLGLYRMLTRFRVPHWMRLVCRPEIIQTEFGFAQNQFGEDMFHPVGNAQQKKLLIPNKSSNLKSRQIDLWEKGIF